MDIRPSARKRGASRLARNGQRPIPQRVFLSHTAELCNLPESGSFVAAAEAAIAAAGDVAMNMAYYTAHDAPPARVDHDMVASSDVYLLIAGFCYGTPVRDRPELSYTEHEFDTATHLGIPRLVFLLSDQAVGPGQLFRDPRNGARQERFRQRLRDSVTTRDVTSPDDLKAAVLQALIELPRPRTPGSPVGRIWGFSARPVRITSRREPPDRRQ